MKKPIMIGITGKRNVGKSTAATLLQQEFGFSKIHAFDGGKWATYSFFEYITGNEKTAFNMVYGDLKDKPSEYLPNNVAPRYFLEHFGKFMGLDMGIDWTLAMEINRSQRLNPNASIVVESLVYEADWFKSQGGIILRLDRPEFAGPVVDSDIFQATIQEDYKITARTADELEVKVRQFAREIVG